MPLPERVAHLQKRGPLQVVTLPETVKDTPLEDQHLLKKGPEPGGSPNPKTGTLAIHPSEAHGND